MPKKYGVKEKDLVVSHVVNLVLTGKLRSGDRVDRNEIAHELGLSRVPIQEAVVQLEHDGILSTRYHRGAFVERFDESVVREHHELHGILLRHRVGARRRRPAPASALDQLDTLTDFMRANRESRAFQESCLAVPADHQRRIRRPAAAGRDPGVADLHPAVVLGDVPEQPRRDAAVLRGRDARPSTRATPTARAPHARAGPRRWAGS